MHPGKKCLLSAESAVCSRKQWVGRIVLRSLVFRLEPVPGRGLREIYLHWLGPLNHGMTSVTVWTLERFLERCLGQVKAAYVPPDPVNGKNQNAGGQNPRCDYQPQSWRQPHQEESKFWLLSIFHCWWSSAYLLLFLIIITSAACLARQTDQNLLYQWKWLYNFRPSYRFWISINWKTFKPNHSKLPSIALCGYPL